MLGRRGPQGDLFRPDEDGVILATDVRAGNVADRQDAAALVAGAAERSVSVWVGRRAVADQKSAYCSVRERVQ